MKTRTPADPDKLRDLVRRLERAARRHDGLALHGRLRHALLGCIQDGRWRAGDRLPAELELAGATGLSMGTIQRALRDLVEEGVVTRRQGRGSFVTAAPGRIGDLWHCRFLGDDGVTVLPVYSHALGRRPAPRKGPWRAHFSAGARLLRLDRRLNVNHEFDVFSRFFFDRDRFQGLATRPLADLAGASLRLLMGQEAYAPPGPVTQTMRVVEAAPDVARVLGLPPGAWVARIDIVRHCAGEGDALYYQQMFVPPTARPLVTHGGREDRAADSA